MPDLSFIIPAKNESQYIEDCLSSIKQLDGIASAEVIVIDNQSTDNTAQIAQNLGARVIENATGTIGHLRNQGVQLANASTLVFIDADVVITDKWVAEIKARLNALKINPKLLTGSHCRAPDSDPALFRTWFNAFADEPDARHIGTGHLICQKDFFNEIGGFSETLSTGEDYEFCQRAIEHQAEIRNDPQLVVYHLDFPKTVGRFIKREAWHGRGDLSTPKLAFTSKPFVASLVFGLLHLALIIGIVTGQFGLGWLAAAAIVGLVLLSSWAKFRHASHTGVLLQNSVVFYAYYWGRLFSLGHLGKA